MERWTTTLCSALLLALVAGPSFAAEPTAVEITAPDGVRLVATYTPAAQPGPGVLLLHMCNSDRSAWKDLSARLARRGIHSLALDYRGYGDSAGEAPSGPERRRVRSEVWPGDVDAAFDFLRSRPGVNRERVGAAGGSCGVNQVLQLARRHPGEVQALALLAGSTDFDAESFLADNPWLPVFASASLDDGNAVESLRWTLGYSSHPDNRFVEYSHGGHGTEMFAVHRDLEPAIAEWFERHLVTRPVTRPDRVVPKPGPSARLVADITAPGGLDRLRSSRAEGEEMPAGLENVVNREGYRLISAGEASRAIELLAFNVEAFPQSANALDSLGDAYLAAGQAEKAAELARRAIAAIPKDPSLGEAMADAIRQSAESKLAESSSESE